MKNTTFYLILLVAHVSMCPAATKPHDLVYVHPRPGAEYISPQSRILIKTGAQSGKTDLNFHVHGNISGRHAGKTTISGHTVIFQSHVPFSPHETVSVRISDGRGEWEGPFCYAFKTTAILPAAPGIPHQRTVPRVSLSGGRTTNQAGVTLINGVAVPGDFPRFAPSINMQGTAPGKLFVTNWIGTPYFMVLENDGTPYFYDVANTRCRDFRVQPNGMLTRWTWENGKCFFGMDAQYTHIDTFQAVNGYQTDEHELFMLPDGRYFLIVFGYRTKDMSVLVDGGHKKARIKDCHVQEFDKNGNLVFEWLCHDHFDVMDAIGVDLKNQSIDYIHMNSIDLDYDDNIIVSSRHFSEVTKINRRTGEVMWRLGGRNNQFDFINDDHGISYQHDARAVPGKPNHYTIFDNGNHHNPRFSRGVEFKLDPANKTAEKVWEYRYPDGSTWWMGNVQILPNGNRLINWADGSVPKATELTPDGRVVYEGDFVEYNHCYRTYRYTWKSVTHKPRLFIDVMPDRIILIFNKFGDKEVEKYIVYGGTGENNMAPMDTTAMTYSVLRDLKNNNWYSFKVLAVDKNGGRSEFSDIKKTFVKLVSPGDNILENGDFSAGRKNWELMLHDTDATSGVNDRGEFYIRIEDGGSQRWHIQLRHENVPLSHGSTYLFEFDAYAGGNKTIDAKLERSGPPYENYGKIGSSFITRDKQHFAYQFDMTEATDPKARVVFNCGQSETDIYLDNVAVSLVGGPAGVEGSEDLPQGTELSQNYPNPFNDHTIIKFTLERKSNVTLKIFDIRGRTVTTLVKGIRQAGHHELEVDARKWVSGIYFYELSANGNKKTKKLLLVR